MQKLSRGTKAGRTSRHLHSISDKPHAPLGFFALFSFASRKKLTSGGSHQNGSASSIINSAAHLAIIALYLGVGVAFYHSSGTTYVSKPCESVTALQNASAQQIAACLNWDSTCNCTEAWTVIDSVYFSMASMSTVGYGDLSPSASGGSRIFTSFFILVGMIGPFYILSIALGRRLVRIESMYRYLTVKLGFKWKEVDIDGDGAADLQVPPHVFLYYLEGFAFWIFMIVVTNFGSAGVLYALLRQHFDDEVRGRVDLLGQDYEWATPDYWDALYHCWVTTTTVGYGDVRMMTQAARLWTSIHIAYAVGILGGFLSKMQELSDERKRQLKRWEMLQKKLDVELMMSLDKDGNGVDKLEFVVGMLTNLDIISSGDVAPFLVQFDKFDADKSGVLNRDDLIKIAEEEQKKAARLLSDENSRRREYKLVRNVASFTNRKFGRRKKIDGGERSRRGKDRSNDSNDSHV